MLCETANRSSSLVVSLVAPCCTVFDREMPGLADRGPVSVQIELTAGPPPKRRVDISFHTGPVFPGPMRLLRNAFRWRM